MTDTPCASVIINNYNYGQFLADAIESALAQTFPNTEVIVVDDGSTDSSRDVIRKYSERVLGVFKQNGGQGSAYNAGFEVSTGEIVSFLDSDDTLEPEAMATAFRLMQEPQIVKAQWPLRVVDVDGNWHGMLSTKQTPPTGDLRRRVIEDGPLYDFEFTTGSAYRRSFLKHVLPMPEAPYRNGGDVYLITLAPTFGEIRTASRPLGTYRAHGRNNFRDNRLDEQRVRNYLQRFESNCAVLEHQLVRQGEHPNVDQWKERNFNYLWPTRWLHAVSEIEALILPGQSYVFVDNDEWGQREPVVGRYAIPFLERGGEYWGPPSDDDTAISQLDRLISEERISHVVVWWTAYWWLEHYAKFGNWLRSRHKCVLESDALLGFELLPKCDLCGNP
jgi:glycosyltransferase involved in cell wall biosynthesis